MELVSRAQVYVVIPAYNEGTLLSRVVTEVKRAGYAVVVVDDGSADSTADHAHAAGAFVVRHPFNLGQGAALQTGIDYALTQAAQFVVTFDADGQHRVSDISRLIEALVRERADFALGSRFLGQAPNLPPLRRLVLQAATLFTRLTTRLQVTDTHNGLRAMTRRGAAALTLRQNRMAHASECLSQIGSSGLRYVEQPRSNTPPIPWPKGRTCAMRCSSCSICLRAGCTDDRAIDPLGAVGGNPAVRLD
jgi:hypothetical protein